MKDINNQSINKVLTKRTVVVSHFFDFFLKIMSKSSKF